LSGQILNLMLAIGEWPWCCTFISFSIRVHALSDFWKIPQLQFIFKWNANGIFCSSTHIFWSGNTDYVVSNYQCTILPKRVSKSTSCMLYKSVWPIQTLRILPFKHLYLITKGHPEKS
jgi:hypothetical protein